eukprot:9148080-Heterocapsa_arctica.AAC.1
MVIARMPEDRSKTFKHHQSHTHLYVYTLIRWTSLAENVVAHPIVIARALPDSPVSTKLLMFCVLNDPLDGSGSKCR